MLLLEIKKYLQDGQKILFCLLSAVLTCALLYLGVNRLLERQSLFEPFTIGVVDYDRSPEFQFLLDFFNDTVQLELLEKVEAEKRLAEGEIPAYVEFPENFAADIIAGVNSPFKLQGSRELPMQFAVSKLLASGAVAFLSSSQSGIYATVDYAAGHGLSRQFINDYVVYPVNVAFIKRLLAYEDFFMPHTTAMTGAIPPAVFYVCMLAVFWFLINLLAFVKTLRGYTPAIYARYKLAGYSILRVQLIRLAGLFCLNGLLILPLVYLAVFVFAGIGTTLPSVLAVGLAGLVTALCVSAFGLMASSLFKNDAACGLFIFMTALVMLFWAGGLIPLAYLPRSMHVLRYFTINYWAVTAVGVTGFSGAAWDFYKAIGSLLLFAVVFFGVVLFVEFLYTAFSRKA